jgi:hypothetical protein
MNPHPGEVWANCNPVRTQSGTVARETDVSKPYHEMTAAERLADRIAKNRRIEQGLIAGKGGLSLDGIVAQLDARRQRATYGAVAELVGVLPIGLMSGRRKSYRDSWIVAGGQGSRRGWPTDYTTNQIHPVCYSQICHGVDNIIDSGKALKQWLDTK